MKVVLIDRGVVNLLQTPSYCRDDVDRVRFLSWKLGHTKVISSVDKVRYISEKDCFELRHLGIA